MKEKYYDSTSSLVMGIFFVVLSVLLLVGKNRLYRFIIDIVIFVFFGLFFLDLIRYSFRKQNKAKKIQVLISLFVHLIVYLFFLSIPNLFYSIVPVLFSVYLCLIGFSQFVMCFLSIKNGEFVLISKFLMGVIYLGIALPIMTSPVSNLDTFITCFNIYTLLLGIYNISDFFVQVLSLKTKNKLKRSIRITLPKIVEALIPYSVMVEINKSLEVEYVSSTSGDKDLEILIHTSNRGFNRMGHIDIYFDGKVISYGNYDEGSRRFKDFFGDGVLFITDKRDEYINFCIDNSKKTLFTFGISLTKKQKEQVQKRIAELIDNTFLWDYQSDKKYNNGSSYAAKLYKKTKASFYKFKKGKYKTYFILGTNCCFLADDIIGCSGMDILSINGIITPGTYYDYLNRLLGLKNSNVVSKDIYNSDHRAG